jgi:nucleoside-diphosphate-sugar epimerase
VRGDVLHPESMTEAMRGSDVVFHLAGWYEVGSDDWMRAEALNVAGTRNVLGLAYELGVPRIVYTSSIVVFGDTRDDLVDETFVPSGRFATEYDRTKWLAHYKVALPLIEQGAPIIVVQPGVVYGPGDHSLVGVLMRWFHQGKLRVIPAPGFTITYAHVDDIAEGHILAAEKGRIGESYILAGPAVPLGEIVDFWSQLTARSAPLLRIPAALLMPLAPLAGLVDDLVSLPEPFKEETIRMLGTNYAARADKARAELGWRTRSLQEGMSETFRWLAETTPLAPRSPERQRQLIAGAALFGVALALFLWLLGRKRDA